MPNYPNIRFSKETKIVPILGLQVHIADDGLVRANYHRTNQYYSLTIVHRDITGAEATTLKTFVETNIESATIDFRDVETAAGAGGWGYRGRIGSEPVIQPSVSDRWNASINLIAFRALLFAS